MKSRARSLCTVLLAAGVSVAACSGDDEVTTSGDGRKGSGGTGGVFGTGGGSFGASGDSGAAGAAGISGNAGAGGTGFGGSGGSPPDASVGGTAGSGTAGAGTTCNSQFCPNTGMGTPCCVTPQGPCGMNYGPGCVGDPGNNRG